MYRRPIRVYTLLTELQVGMLDQLALYNRRSRSGMLHAIIWDWLARMEMHDEFVGEMLRQYRAEVDAGRFSAEDAVGLYPKWHANWSDVELAELAKDG